MEYPSPNHVLITLGKYGEELPETLSSDSEEETVVRTPI